MHVVVIGSGLLGVSTAYWLRALGADVTVIDRASGPGRETSFANGALLTPSMSDPWNAPGVFWKLLGWLGREDSPMLLRPRAVPGLARWGIRFLRESAEPRFRANTLANMRLAQYSLASLHALRGNGAMQFDHAEVGTLKLVRNPGSFVAARRMAEWLAEHGVTSRALDREATVVLEPALGPIAAELVGSIHFPADEHGDAFRYCESVAAMAARDGVRFRYGTTVTALDLKGALIARVRTREGDVAADSVVVAAGSYSPQLVASTGIQVPVAPVKGYSISTEVPAGVAAPRIPILDEELHAVAVPLGTRLRLAGTAEFAGHDLSVPPARIENLVRLLERTYPEIAARVPRESIEAWSGLRPMSADGVPIVSRTPIGNLYLNTGHGHLGWTMAAGSGRALADLVMGRTPAIDLAPYALARFN
jgi:D-amino-acid dehydrogenase